MELNSSLKKWMIEYFASFVDDDLMKQLQNATYHTANRKIKIYGREERWLKALLQQIDSGDEFTENSELN